MGGEEREIQNLLQKTPNIHIALLVSMRGSATTTSSSWKITCSTNKLKARTLVLVGVAQQFTIDERECKILHSEGNK